MLLALASVRFSQFQLTWLLFLLAHGPLAVRQFPLLRTFGQIAWAAHCPNGPPCIRGAGTLLSKRGFG